MEELNDIKFVVYVSGRNVRRAVEKCVEEDKPESFVEILKMILREKSYTRIEISPIKPTVVE